VARVAEGLVAQLDVADPAELLVHRPVFALEGPAVRPRGGYVPRRAGLPWVSVTVPVFLPAEAAS
jgi:hypothetical protein